MIRSSITLALAAGAVVTLVAQHGPVFRVTRDTVPVFVTVTDKDNRLASAGVKTFRCSTAANRRR
jgi:hypothetical protein